MDFVWIYAERFSAWHKMGLFNELDYSIRSVKKNFQGEARCFVVGDNPNLEGVIHLEAPPVVMHDPIHKQPQHADNINKMDVILNSEVNEEFVIMYDDIFLLKPTTKEDLQVTYGREEVIKPDEYIRTRRGGTPYKRLWVSTYEYIVTYRHMNGLKTYDWETHLPRFMVKNNLKWVIEKLNLRNIPRIYTSVYSCHFSEETKLIPEGFQSDIWAHTPGMDFDKEFSCHHMVIGDDIIVPEFMERMYELFGR